MKKLKVLDLFAGAGGLSCGFIQTGCFEIKAAVENNKEAQDTYKRNHSSTAIYDNIKDIDFKLPEFKDIEVIIGGPPCQGFSNANRNKSGFISSNNELVKEFIRAVEEINPIAFVLENVCSIESKLHKFFLCRNNIQELNNLEIEVSPESISIGKIYPFASDLIKFIENHEAADLTCYMVNKNVLSKLKAIYNKLNKLSPEAFCSYLSIPHTRKFLNRLLNTHDTIHKYWIASYKEVWEKLMHQLSECLNENIIPISLNTLLETVIDVNYIISTSIEMKKNNLDAVYRIDYNKQKLFADVKTYNVFKYLTAKLDKLDYEILPETLNSAEYGTAQIRRRLFILGVKRDILKGKPLKFPPSKIFDQEKDYIPIRHAIIDLDNIEPETNIGSDFKVSPRPASDQNRRYWQYLNNGSVEVHNHIITESTDTALRRFQALKPGQNFHDLDASYKENYSDVSKTQHTIYKRLSYDEPSGTVLNVRKSMWIHPTKHRAISIREAARLQSFPDTYIFEGFKNSQYQQVGNAVPPSLARAVAESLLDTLGINVPLRLSEFLTDIKKQESLS